MAHLNINEVLERLGLDAEAIRRHVKEGALQPFRTKAADGSHQICFRAEDVAALAARLGVKPAEPAAADELVLDLEEGGQPEAITMPESSAPAELDLDVDGPAPAAEEFSIDTSEQSAPGAEAPTTMQPAARQEAQDATIELDGPAEEAGEASEAATKTDAGDGSETISFDLDGDNALALPDETLTLTDDTAKAEQSEGATEAVSLDEGGGEGEGSRSRKAAAVVAPSAPVTKIVNEPNIHFLWGILILLTFGVITYFGLVNFGIVRLEGSETFLGQQPNFYQGVSSFVKEYFYFPPN